MTTRRDFIKKSLRLAAGIMASFRAFPAPYIKKFESIDRVIVLGIDGLDPFLLKKFIDEGRLPAFQQMAVPGRWSKLRTTTPPQSPVAWSSFISGTNPGGHGIFDFVHRDPASFTPFLSTSKSFPPRRSLSLGEWRIPLESGHYELLRRGPSFWTFLEEHGISATLFKLPANFPVSRSNTRMISGMGTPDLLGSYGTFTLIAEGSIPNAEKMSGGRVVEVVLRDHIGHTTLEGPSNPLMRDSSPAAVPITIARDPWESAVKIDLADQTLLMKQGEWSEWIPLRFDLLPPFFSIHGMVRIYVKQVHPQLRIYVSPINADPLHPQLPISNPSSWSAELAAKIGRYYTQGFPEDTKALSNDVFSDEEFIEQSKIVLTEQQSIFERLLSQFAEGLLFFYFSSIDQTSHMLWRTMVPSHRLYDSRASQPVKEALSFFYRAMDDVVNLTLKSMPKASTLIIMSDHGFAPFTREFHLSSWLVENGYTVISGPEAGEKSVFFDAVDWSKTKAYALGLNGIYINTAGREKYGSVQPGDIQKIKEEIIERLCSQVDPVTQKKPIAAAYDSARVYSGPYLETAPDIIVGYARGYRISDEAALGNFPRGIFRDREDKWSADHCMAPHLVPGTILANKEIRKENPALWDMAPTILKLFGIDTPIEMEGRSIFEA